MWGQVMLGQVGSFVHIYYGIGRYVRGMFQKYAEMFNNNHNLHLIKLCFWYMKLEHMSNYFRQFGILVHPLYG